MTHPDRASRRRSERGATVVEYALTASVAAIIGVGGVTGLHPLMQAVFERGACDDASGYHCEETAP